MIIYEAIKQLVEYGVDKKLVEPEDRIYTTNLILEILGLSEYQEPSEYNKIETPEDLEDTLRIMLYYGVETGALESDSIVHRDLFDTKLMNTLMPRPSQVIKSFWEKYRICPEEATKYFYKMSKDSDYIRTYRIIRDKKWVVETEYGNIDITINLSKPEKDPKMIAMAKDLPASTYPKCLLCMENEGYAGRVNHPARENHRIIPIEINGKRWGFQYSPYVYYNEHCIVFNGEHIPMSVNRDTFVKLFDFIKLFPHYFIGSNADLPIVGGSILSHDHFQGGRYTFAMESAPIDRKINFSGFEDIDAGIVKWPMSVIRLNGRDYNRIIALADKILSRWRGYTDEEAYIFAETKGEPHNTITPIARMRDDKFELDLVLRNNITTDEHPMGLFHPWDKYHNIKKENIGLIEVMGLAVLPARLLQEMKLLGEAVVKGENIADNPEISKHARWAANFVSKYHNIDETNVERILQEEIGVSFVEILKCAGVFKRDDKGRGQFLKFVNYVNQD